MTTPTSDAIAEAAPAPGRFRLPDIPERDPDEVSQFDSLFKHGKSRDLAIHLGDPETTLVEADRWIVPDASFDKRRARYPDLLVAFDVSPAEYEASNGYIVSEQGKAPDFVLEVASPSTAHRDLNEKRDFYASIGVREYWRFDRTGEHYGTRLYGERLEGGVYGPIPRDELPGGDLQSYSPALGLNLRTEGEELRFCDPATGQPVASFESERARADAAEAERNAERAQVNAERARANAAEAERDAERMRADMERARADTAETRLHELEEQLRRQQQSSP
ncbi:MAG: Uma2 family endonuclease [Chloroflexota bacterium]|nr:Uma2 family endonuclease [Chloroflexota bacterium]MDE2961978.1 Uma2 family endonuclease [Chloroflexota bacterium]